LSQASYLFDTDAISELLRRRPLPAYVEWLRYVPREDQFTSAVVVGELFEGAFRSGAVDRHLRGIEDRVLPSITVIPFETRAARVFGKIAAELRTRGQPLPDADLQIAATALHHGLELVTGNVQHFERVPGLLIARILQDARSM